MIARTSPAVIVAIALGVLSAVLLLRAAVKTDRGLIAVRAFRTRAIWRFRATFGLYKNEARDRLLEGAIRDNEQLSKALSGHSVIISNLFERLAWYEKNVPALAKQRSAFDADKRRRAKKRAADALRKNPPQPGIEP